jgi:hypothetical protein
MASKIIFDESEAEQAKDYYAETLARMSLSELLYFVLTRDASPMQIAPTAKGDHSEFRLADRPRRGEMIGDRLCAMFMMDQTETSRRC